MKALGVIIGVVGTALSIWFGLWVMLVGGISTVVDAVQEDPIVGSTVAWGVVKTLFAGTVTSFGVALSWIAAIALAED